MGAAVDTLQIYERLIKAELNERAAKELAEVFKETIDEQLATKADLTRSENKLTEAIAKTKAELEASLAATKAELIKWVAGMLVAQAAVIAALVKLIQ
jgi:hypothetical protein